MFPISRTTVRLFFIAQQLSRKIGIEQSVKTCHNIFSALRSPERERQADQPGAARPDESDLIQ